MPVIFNKMENFPPKITDYFDPEEFHDIEKIEYEFYKASRKLWGISFVDYEVKNGTKL